MPILRINQHPGSAPNTYLIDVGAVDVHGFQPSSFSRPIQFVMSPQDGELIRWYLEDYLQFDQDPAPTIAKRAEKLMAERGERAAATQIQDTERRIALIDKAAAAKRGNP